MEQMLVECCEKFIEFISVLKNTGKITKEEYDEMTKLKIEFLTRHS